MYITFKALIKKTAFLIQEGNTGFIDTWGQNFKLSC